MKFDVTYQGKVYSMVGGVLYEYRNGGFAGVGTDGATRQVTLTGYRETSQRGSVGYQTTSGYWVELDEGWQLIGTVAIASYSQSAAQAQANKIIANNKIIIRNNLLCARFAKRFTEQQQAQIRELQSRLQARNAALQAGGLTENVQTGYPKEYAELSGYLEALMNGEAIGVATWVVVVIAATVIAATATAAYYTYKRLADESEVDAKFSKELTATLVSKLTPEEYQQLLDETKGLLTKAKIKQLVRGTSKWLLLAGVAAAGAFYILKKRNIL